MTSLSDELERLAALRTSGALTEAEFLAAKSRLLQNPTAPATPATGKNNIWSRAESVLIPADNGPVNKPSYKWTTGRIIGASLFCLLVLLYVMAGSKSSGGKTQQDYIREDRADGIQQALSKYEFAKNNGTQSDRCSAASFVAYNYKESQDAENYKKWSEIEHEECPY